MQNWRSDHQRRLYNNAAHRVFFSTWKNCFAKW